MSKINGNLTGCGQEDTSGEQSCGQPDPADNLFDSRMDRIRTAVNADSDAELARILGLKQQTISAARARKQLPSSWILQIADNFGVSADWLLYGTGPMRRAEGTYSGGGKESYSARCLDIDEYILVPQLESRVTAGPEGEILYEEVTEHFPFKKWWIDKLVGKTEAHQKALILVRVRGESMTPTINPGEVVLVDTFEAERMQVRNGQVYLVSLPDGTTALKRVVMIPYEASMKILCMSDNTSTFRPFEFEVEPSLRLKNYILGRVRWAGKEFD